MDTDGARRHDAPERWKKKFHQYFKSAEFLRFSYVYFR